VCIACVEISQFVAKNHGAEASYSQKAYEKQYVIGQKTMSGKIFVTLTNLVAFTSKTT